VDLRKAVGDYAPDENGIWKEAVVRYGKGKVIANEMETRKLRIQKGDPDEAGRQGKKQVKNKKQIGKKGKR
jgi:hypothetical protein